MFVVVYWWRAHPGKEEQFRRSWARGTELITARYGSLGSRLHQEADGRFVAIAEWPDEESWQRAIDVKMVYDEPETRRAFVESIAETPPGNLPAFTMHVTDNLLVRSGGIK